MKNIIIAFLLLLFPIVGSEGQEIEYGSNNGQYLKAAGLQIYYEEYGQGTPLLMFHGDAGSIKNFENVIPQLVRRFRVIAIDSPGHGKSEQPESLSYQLYSDCFSEIIDKLKLDSCYVIGWSGGGIGALMFAADRPDKVKRVIASGAQLNDAGYTDEDTRIDFTTITPERVEKEWGSWKEDYLKAAPKNFDWELLINQLRTLWSQEIFIPDEKLDKINSKTLIVFGDRDIVSLEQGTDMFRRIKKSQLLILPNTGHAAVFRERSNIFVTIALEFFQN